MASEEEQHSGGDAVVAALEQAGVRVVFGIPSVHNLPIYDALARRGKIRAITVRHEQGAAGAADGYARSSGRIGVFITSTGPGAANAMGGLLEAYVSGSPVLHLTGQVETSYLGKGRGFIHEVPDQPAMLASLSKAVLRAESAGEIGRIVEAAIELALSHPRGPVSVELPIDLQYAPAGSPPAARDLPQASDAPDGEPAWVDAARAALPVLSAAKRPIIWAGGGAVSSGAEDEVAVLAGRLGAGVLTSPNGRGVISELDPLCIGNLSWDPDVRSLLREADVLIGLGTRYQGPNTENWKMELPGRIIQVDVDLRVPSLNYEPEIAVPGDVKEVLGLMLQELPEPSVDDRVWRQRIEQAKVAAHGRLRKSLGAQQGLLDA
ncbi:MAG: thiamine pyrophosphate-binding protein, partial [Acidimicrobiales bacterium]